MDYLKRAKGKRGTTSAEAKREFVDAPAAAITIAITIAASGAV